MISAVERPDPEHHMLQEEQAATAAMGQRPGRSAGWAVVQCLILVALCVWAFWPELCFIYRAVVENSDWAHAAAVPSALLILLHRRRALRLQ